MENKMSKLSIYISKSQKVRMDYSKYGIYTCNHVEFTLFRVVKKTLSSSYNISGLVPVCWLLFQCF